MSGHQSNSSEKVQASPLPWRQRLTAGIPQTVIEDSRGTTLANIVWSDDGSWQADVDLIVRAVNNHADLLAALTALLAEVTTPGEEWSEGTAVRNARTVIRRATT